MATIYDVIIIGGGPAGLTAGLYASRSALKTLLLEKMAPGGLIALTSDVENYPGFPDPVNGFELTDRMTKQAKKFGLAITTARVTRIEEINQPASFRIKTDQETYQSYTIIIASGTQPRKLGVPNEDKLTGKGISFCATCDAPFFKGKEVAVVGGGDTAVEEAIFLTRFVSKISIIHRRDQLRAAAIIQKRALANPKINFIWDSVIIEVTGQDKVTGVAIKNVKTSQISPLKVDGLFIFIGWLPNTDFLKSFIELDKAGFVITDRNMQTARKGIYACGDVIQKNFRQVITACAEGATAAWQAEHYINEIK